MTLASITSIESPRRRGITSALRVLLIEDDSDDVYFVHKALKEDPRRHYEAMHVNSLHDALPQLHSFEPHAILLDLGLTDSDGLDTLKFLLESEPSCPIVVLTGAGDALGEEAIALGAMDYLPKFELSAQLLKRSISYAIERHNLIYELRNKAFYDPLTGVTNRIGLIERLELNIHQAERNQHKLAIAMLDVDDFKIINDTYGHRAGDDYLRQIGARLRRETRSADLAARYGGDEFVLIFTNYQNLKDLEKALRRKRKVLSQDLYIAVNKRPLKLPVSISIGVVEWTPGTSLQALIDRADSTMYRDKRSKTGEVFFYQ